MRRANLICIAVLAAAFWVRPDAASAQLAAQMIHSGIGGIVAFVEDPVLPGTFYLAQLSGRIDVLQDGNVLPTPFLDLTDVVEAGIEQGLLGMAFAPDAATSGRVFVNFIDATGATVIARFAKREDNPLVADPATRFDLVWSPGVDSISRPGSNHHGGHLAFGPDGYLYIGLGDGGPGIDPFNHAQNPDSLLGKMLRIDVNVASDDPKGYRIPPDNPFLPYPVLPEIWDFGLRNPWRYSFDNPALGGTGALIIGDVGEQSREEVNYEPAGRGGRNYGWRMREGSIPTPNVPPTTPAFLPLTEPLFDYPRPPTVGQSVTSGYVYRGSLLPDQFKGRYFAADFISGTVVSVSLSVNPVTHDASVTGIFDHTAELGGEALGRIVSFGEDRAGELYMVRIDPPGAVFKIVPRSGAPSPPSGFTSIVSGTTVALSWVPGPGGLPSTYRLEVGSLPGSSNLLVTDIAGAVTSLTAPGVADGTYYARLRAMNELGTSEPSAEVRIDVGCTAPPAPTGLVHVVGSGVVALVWNRVPGATGYLLEAGSATGQADLAVLPLLPTLPGLVVPAPPNTYFVRVRAQSACAVSPPSNEVTVVVP